MDWEEVKKQRESQVDWEQVKISRGYKPPSLAVEPTEKALTTTKLSTINIGGEEVPVSENFIPNTTLSTAQKHSGIPQSEHRKLRIEKGISNPFEEYVMNPLGAFVTGAIDTATLGGASRLRKEVTGKDLYQSTTTPNVNLRETNKRSKFAGNLAGYMLPYSTAKKAVNGSKAGKLVENIGTKTADKVSSKLTGKVGEQTAKIIGKGVGNFVAERAVDAPLDVALGTTEGIVRGNSAKDTIKNIGTDLVFGSLIDAGTNSAKVYKVLKTNDLLPNVKVKEKGPMPSKQVIIKEPKAKTFNLDSTSNIEQLDDYVKETDNSIKNTTDQQVKVELQKTNQNAKNKSKKLRKFVDNSIMNSDIVPEDIKQHYKDNPSVYEYEPISNKEMLDSAREIVEKNPQKHTNDFLTLDNLRSVDDTVLGEALIQKHIAEGDYQNAINISTKLSELLTNAGQQVQAASIMKKMTPEGMLQYANKQIKKAKGVGESKVAKDIVNKAKNIADSDLTPAQKEAKLKQLFKEKRIKVKKDDFDKINQYVTLGGFEHAKFKNLIEKKLGIPSLNETDVRTIVDTMNNVQAMKDGRAKDIEVAKVMQLIADKIPTSSSEKFKSFLRLSMLMNPKTLITRNPLGNVVFGALENVRQPITGLTDMATSKLLKTDRTTTLLPNIKAQAQGFKKGAKELIEDTKLGVDTSPSRGGYELPHTKKVFGEKKTLNKLHNFMGTLLQLGDRPFFEGAYQQRIKELQKLGKTSDVTDEMIEDATNFALERVFQNEGSATRLARKAKQGLNEINLGGIGLGDITLPFTHTPANITAKGIEYTPLGIIKALKEAPTSKKLMNGSFNQKAFTDAIGRSMTGSAIALLGYNMAKNNLATGQGEKSEKLRELNKLRGEQQYSIKFGNKSYTFDWAQPASIPLAVGIDFFNASKSEEELSQAVEKGLESGGNTLFNQSFLQGINRMMGGYSPSRGIAETIKNAPMMAIPTGVGQIAQMNDKYKREIDYTGLKGLKQQVTRKTPVASKTLYPQVDVFGNEVENYQGRKGAGKAVEVFLSPGYYTKNKDNDVTKELLRLNKQTASNDILPRVAKDFTFKGKKIQLSDKEKYEMQKYMGQETYEKMEKLINSPHYQKLSEEGKEKALSNLVADIYNASKERVVKGREN
jgi:hypothetical protein